VLVILANGCGGPTLEHGDPRGNDWKSRRLPELDPMRREYVTAQR